MLAVFLMLILEGTLYDVITTARTKRYKEKEAEENKEKPSLQENGNSPPEYNSYKLRVENGNTQQPETGRTRVQKQGQFIVNL